MGTKTGIFYGSTLGTTEAVATQIGEKLGVGAADIHNVADSDPSAVQAYDTLLLGSSTWGSGELQDDWCNFIDRLKEIDLSGKTVALFGCGDSAGYSDTFCDAIGLLHDSLAASGCRFIGACDPSGYTFDSSIALQEGRFVGLPIDENNESHLTAERIDRWTEQLKTELS